MILDGRFFDLASMAQNETSEIIDMRDRGSVGFFIKSPSGTRAGTLTLEAKMGQSDWYTKQFYDGTGALVSSISVSAATALEAEVSFASGGVNVDYLRWQWTRTAGDGTLTGDANRGNQNG